MGRSRPTRSGAQVRFVDRHLHQSPVDDRDHVEDGNEAPRAGTASWLGLGRFPMFSSRARICSRSASSVAGSRSESEAGEAGTVDRAVKGKQGVINRFATYARIHWTGLRPSLCGEWRSKSRDPDACILARDCAKRLPTFKQIMAIDSAHML